MLTDKLTQNGILFLLTENQHMKRIIIVVTAVLVVAAGAGATYFLLNRDSGDQASLGSSEISTSGSDSEEVSINDLLTRNASLECTYDVVDGESTNTGIAYFSGAKDMYGEFTNKTEDKSSTAYVIRRGDTQYVWQKDANEGYKADVSAYDKDKQQQMSQQLDPDQKYKFSCKDWKKDTSKFEVPADIQFTDISAQLNQAQTASDEAREQACEALSNADAKAACKNAI